MSGFDSLFGVAKFLVSSNNEKLNTADGIKLIKFTAQYGYAYGALLLGYCYDNGIGVQKDYNIASAYYDRAGVSGGADESYKFHGWGDRTHRSRAYAVAEKIYNERI